MFTDNVAAIDGDILMGTDGPNGLRTVATRLLAMGHDPDRELMATSAVIWITCRVISQ